MEELRHLADERYVGDKSSMNVHDRWHGECEDCLMEDLIEKGVAVRFDPDSLDQAFMEGFDYCSSCIDRTDPAPPESISRPGQSLR